MNPKILIVRGKYINQYEMQNYEPMVDMGFDLYGVGSLKSIHDQFKFPLIKLFSPPDLPNFPYKMPILNRLCFGDAMYLFGLSKVVKNIQPDVVHGRETYFHFTYQLAKLRAQNQIKKLIVTCSETRPFNHEGIWRRKTIKNFVKKHTDLFHTLTNKAKEALIIEGVSPDKITVIPYGVDQSLFKPQFPIKSLKNKIRLLFVGRLVPEKGIHDLIKIYHALKKSKINFSFTIIGQGPLSKLLQQNHLSFDSAPYHQMPSIYQQTDILISLSKTTSYWEELYGMNLVEAQSCAVVPLAYNSGAIPEVIPHHDLLVPENNWTKIVQKIINFYRHPQKLTQTKHQIYNYAKKHYDAIKQAAKIAQLYND